MGLPRPCGRPARVGGRDRHLVIVPSSTGANRTPNTLLVSLCFCCTASVSEPIGELFKPAGKPDERGDHADADKQVDENDDRAAVGGHVLT
jgi:hypothetical protein